MKYILHYDTTEQSYSYNVIGMMSWGRIHQNDRNNYAYPHMLGMASSGEDMDSSVIPTQWAHQRKTHARKCSVYNMRISRAQPNYEPFSSIDTGNGCVIGIGHFNRQYLIHSSKMFCNSLDTASDYLGPDYGWYEFLVYWGFHPHNLLLPEFQCT